MNATPETLLGLVTVGRTVYQVYGMPVGELSRGSVFHRFALIGPRGASYLVTDYGPGYRINSVACGGARPWSPSPSPLRGLTRAHLAEFVVIP